MVITILLADDQALVRQGLKAMLSLEGDMAVVGEAGNGMEAIELAALLKPDIILLDVRMPEMDGLTALGRIKSVAPSSSVIMVTLYDEADYLLRAVNAGAAGYLLKDASREELIRAVRLTASGGGIIDPSMMPHLLESVRRMGGMGLYPFASDGDVLTAREIQVLRLVAEGLTNQRIAEVLIISPTTAKTHVQNIIQKLGVSDRTQAAVQAVRRGLI